MPAADDDEPEETEALEELWRAVESVSDEIAEAARQVGVGAPEELFALVAVQEDDVEFRLFKRAAARQQYREVPEILELLDKPGSPGAVAVAVCDLTDPEGAIGTGEISLED